DAPPGSGEDVALLLDVRLAFLLDEDHRGRPQVRRGEGAGRADRPPGRHAGEGGRVQKGGAANLSVRFKRKSWRTNGRLPCGSATSPGRSPGSTSRNSTDSSRATSSSSARDHPGSCARATSPLP